MPVDHLISNVHIWKKFSRKCFFFLTLHLCVDVKLETVCLRKCFPALAWWGMFQQCQHTQDKGEGGRCGDYKLSPKAWKRFKILNIIFVKKKFKISNAFSHGQKNITKIMRGPMRGLKIITKNMKTFQEIYLTSSFLILKRVSWTLIHYA